MGQSTYKVSLRVKHPSIAPTFVAGCLGLKPKTSWMAGSDRISPSGAVIGVAEHSYCNFDMTTSANTLLADAIASNVQQLKANKTFLKELIDTGGTVEFYVGWFIGKHAGEIFQSGLLKDLGELGIDLTIEVYGPDAKTFEPEIVRIRREP